MIICNLQLFMKTSVKYVIDFYYGIVFKYVRKHTVKVLHVDFLLK